MDKQQFVTGFSCQLYFARQYLKHVLYEKYETLSIYLRSLKLKDTFITEKYWNVKKEKLKKLHEYYQIGSVFTYIFVSFFTWYRDLQFFHFLGSLDPKSNCIIDTCFFSYSWAAFFHRKYLCLEYRRQQRGPIEVLLSHSYLQFYWPIQAGSLPMQSWLKVLAWSHAGCLVKNHFFPDILKFVQKLRIPEPWRQLAGSWLAYSCSEFLHTLSWEQELLMPPSKWLGKFQSWWIHLKFLPADWLGCLPPELVDLGREMCIPIEKKHFTKTNV